MVERVGSCGKKLKNICLQLLLCRTTEIISVHVTKAVGTTVKNCWLQVYGKEKVFSDSMFIKTVKKVSIKFVPGLTQLNKKLGLFS